MNGIYLASVVLVRVMHWAVPFGVWMLTDPQKGLQLAPTMER